MAFAAQRLKSLVALSALCCCFITYRMVFHEYPDSYPSDDDWRERPGAYGRDIQAQFGTDDDVKSEPSSTHRPKIVGEKAFNPRNISGDCFAIIGPDFADGLVVDLDANKHAMHLDELSKNAEDKTKREDALLSIYCFVIIDPLNSDARLVRTSLMLGALSGCDAFDIFSNTTALPGFMAANGSDCADSKHFVDYLGYRCDEWHLEDCWGDKANEYDGQAEREVRHNCRQKCGTCEAQGSFGLPWPTIIPAISGSVGDDSHSSILDEAYSEVLASILMRRVYRHHDLVVAVNARTMFSPGRIRRLLSGPSLRNILSMSNAELTLDDPIVFQNKYQDAIFNGPIVVMTTSIFTLFESKQRDCFRTLKSNERVFLSFSNCLKEHGATLITDTPGLVDNEDIKQHTRHRNCSTDACSIYPLMSSRQFMACWTEARVTDLTRPPTPYTTCESTPDQRGKQWLRFIN